VDCFQSNQPRGSHHRAVLQVHTVGVGVAIDQSCMLLSAGTKGKRFMLPHATGVSLLTQEKHCSFSAAQVCWQRVNCQQCDRRTKLDCYRPLAYCSVSKLSSVSTYNGNILPCAYSKICYAAAMLQQPRVPPTGQRQAVEIQIKWREVLAQKQAMLKILSQTTGHSPEKLDKVGQGSPFMKVMQAPA